MRDVVKNAYKEFKGIVLIGISLTGAERKGLGAGPNPGVHVHVRSIAVSEKLFKTAMRGGCPCPA